MKELELDLTLPKEIRVVRVAPTVSEVAVPTTLQDESLKPMSKGLLDLLGRWVKVAQAKDSQ